MSEIRQRKTSSNPLAPLINLDAFSKLPEEIEEKTTIGKKSLKMKFYLQQLKESFGFRWNCFADLAAFDNRGYLQRNRILLGHVIIV